MFGAMISSIDDPGLFFAKVADGLAIISWTALSGIVGPSLPLVPKTTNLGLETRDILPPQIIRPKGKIRRHTNGVLSILY